MIKMWSTFRSLGLFVSFLSVLNSRTSLQALELFEVAAKEASATLEGMEKNAFKASAEALMQKMGFSAEESLARLEQLPQSAKDVFKKQLTALFKEEAELINAFKSGSLDKGVNFDSMPKIKAVGSGFQAELKKIGSVEGWSKLEVDALNKFDKTLAIKPEEFPVKSNAALKVAELDKNVGINAVERKLTAAEEKFVEAENKLASAQRDLSYATEQKNTVLRSEKEELVNNLSKESEAAQKALQEERTAKVAKAQQEVEVAKSNANEELKSGDKTQVLKSQENLAQAEKAELSAQQEAVKAERDALGKKIESIDEQLKTASSKEKLQLEQELEVTQGTLKRLGKSVVKSAKNKALNSFKNRLTGFFKDHVFGTLIAAFMFSFPNYMEGSIQQLMEAQAQRDTALLPVHYGKMWMQVPTSLVSAVGDPLSVFNLYVGLEKDPTSEKVTHDASADTDSYLQKAPLFMARTAYDDYGNPAYQAERMVNLDTGRQFIGDGKEVPGEAVIQFLGVPPQNFRGSNLQFQLDSVANKVQSGQGGTEYFEFRYAKSGFKGNHALGDRLDSTKNNQAINALYSEEKDGYASVLNGAITAFYNGTYFGDFKVRAFEAVDEKKLLAFGGTGAVEDKPYVAYGKYVYQTADTPAIKSVQQLLRADTANPENAKLASELVEYVVMLDDEGNPVPLQTPEPSGAYNFPSYVLNPKAKKMLSLFDGTLYGGSKTESSSFDVAKLISSFFPEGAAQINAVKNFVTEKLKYGPFLIGGLSLTIDPELSTNGVPVYKAAKSLEGGFDDYLIVMNGMTVGSLPGSFTNIASLISSRIYDSSLIPYDKLTGKRQDLDYTVYKAQSDLPPLVVAGPPQEKYGTILTQGLKAPLYSLFMDPEINPNLINSKAVADSANQQWLAEKLGIKTWPLPLPVPEQWALSDRGPAVQSGETTKRIGNVLKEKAPKLLATINDIHAKWKQYVIEHAGDETKAQMLAREMAIFPWTHSGVRDIYLRTTGAVDLRNGHFVYVSDFYPGNYLVLADDIEGKNGLGGEFNVAEPQNYAISLSNGNVYDKNKSGQVVAVIADIESLMQRMQHQAPFSTTLSSALKATQSAQRLALQSEQYGPNTAFGRFRFYLFKEDLLRNQFIYGDATDIVDPTLMSEAALFSKITNYYIVISLKDGVKDQPELGASNQAINPANWVYGSKLGANTYRVLSLVDGILYDRGGAYQGYFKEFASSVDNNVDIQQGYLALIINYLKASWQGQSNTELRPVLQQKIVELTKKEYDKLLKEKALIAQAQKDEEAKFKKLEQNTIANITAQPYVQDLEQLDVPRYLKLYGGKYYAVTPEEPKGFIDYNVGPVGKDNKLGVIYDKDGNVLIHLAGWVLDNARSYAGVVVAENGTQSLDIAIDHASIPTARMIKLDSSALEQKINQTRSAFEQASNALAKNPADVTLQQNAQKASQDFYYTQQELQAAQYVKQLRASTALAYDFYYNEDTYVYYVKVNDRYIDLVAGYQYNLDGSPRLVAESVYQSEKNTEDTLFTSKDSNGLLTLYYKGLDQTNYQQWLLTDDVSDKLVGTDLMKYTLLNVNGDNLYLYWNAKEKSYLANILPVDGQDIQEMGLYKEANGLKRSLLRYFKTNNGFSEDDRVLLDPTFIIWNGDSSLALQYLLYKNQLVQLRSGGNNSYAAQYVESGAKKSITVTKQEINHGPAIKGHYVSIVDGSNTYQFLYDTSILEPDSPVTCSAETDIKQLNYWKECVWGINQVADSFGAIQLVTTLPSVLKKPADQDQKRVLAVAGSRASAVSNNIKLLWVDQANNRYLYKLSNARDNGWAYFKPEFEGWYVDIANGVVYRIDTPALGAYPTGSLRASELYLLRSRLELSVADVEDASGKPLFDNAGRLLKDKAGKQILGKPGLIYYSAEAIK